MTASFEASPPGPEPVAGTPSVGDLLADVSRDLSVLMRQELELAKAELKQEATKAGKGAGLMGGAGFAGYMVLLFVSLAVWWALEHAIDVAWAAVVVAVIWAGVGLALFVQGRSTLRALHPKPERTVETVGQIPDALKGQ